MNLKDYLKTKQVLVESSLNQWLPSQAGERLREAMRYSLLAGGKRLRPVLAIAACEACGGEATQALPLACALEMIHTYSLIHDDLPAMDNDSLRRGRPTSHKIYGEAMAILAGDSLLTEAFHVLAQKGREAGIDPTVLVDVIADVARASGVDGMAGGQVMDLAAEGCDIDLKALETLHAYKTGRLIQVAVVAGAKVGGGSPQQVETLARYGEAIGLAFQIADDILDVESGTEVLGKTAGKDQARHKATYPSLLGLEESKKREKDLVQSAIAAASLFKERGEPLKAIASYIIERQN